MDLDLFSAIDDRLIGEEKPIGVKFTFDDNTRFFEEHIFEQTGINVHWIYREGSTSGVFLSKDSVKLLHATLGAYLGK